MEDNHGSSLPGLVIVFLVSPNFCLHANLQKFTIHVPIYSQGVLLEFLYFNTVSSDILFIYDGDSRNNRLLLWHDGDTLPEPLYGR